MATLCNPTLSIDLFTNLEPNVSVTVDNIADLRDTIT